MSTVPLKWAEGDPCIARGERGVVESIGPNCASVKLNEWRRLFVGLDELELMPLPAETPKETHEETKATPQAEDAAPVGEQRKVNRTPRRRARADKPGAAGRVQAPQPSHGDTPPPSRPRVALADYSAFVSTKLTRAPSTGLTKLPDLHPSLFPFQRDLVSWALRRGRAALFADTGLGKTAMQIEWARHIPGDVLILAPLAVAAQTAREGERLGVPVKVCRDGSDVEPGVNVTNYDRLHRFDPSRFTGVVLDESSIIKHHDAKTLANLLAAFADTPFKLCATATPSPNDYTELGTHAEFLGVCSRTEMLAEHFIHDGGDTSKWRLKGHARAAFWRWMSSWAALIRKPSDLGYDDGGYDLPELRITQHTIPADPEQVKAQGLLFAEPARSLTERRAARKSSLSARARDVVKLVTMGCEQCQPTRSDAPTIATGTSGIGSASASTSSQRETVATQNAASSTPATNPIENDVDAQPSKGRAKIRGSAAAKSSAPRSASPQTTSTGCSPSKAGAAPSANESATSTVTAASTSTTAIAPAASGASSAPPAISGSASSATTPSVSKWPRGTCGCPRNEQWVIWCELNSEEEALIDALGREALAVRGSDEALTKEMRAYAWMNGDVRIIVSKPSIFGFGLNWQHAARMAFVGVKDSWESYYQAIRREWRFGQKRPVEVHVFASELEGEVVANLRRKERDAMAMAEQLSAETREAVRAEVRGMVRDTNEYAPAKALAVPEWLKRSA